MATDPTSSEKRPLAPVFWDDLSESKKNEFFTGDISNDGFLHGLLEKYNVVGIDLKEIRFQAQVESTIHEQLEKPDEPVEEPTTHHKATHAASHGHDMHSFSPNTLSKQITDSTEYQEKLKPLQDVRREKWDKKKDGVIKKWERQHKKSITSEDGQKYINGRMDNPDGDGVKLLAEKKFRRDHPDLARKSDEDVSAGSYAHDEIGKQYQDAASKHAQDLLEYRFGKKLKKGKISPERYREEAKKIYAKEQKDFAKMFIRDYKVKAKHYIQQQTDPVLNNAWEETRAGRNNRKTQSITYQAAAKKNTTGYATISVKEPHAPSIIKSEILKNGEGSKKNDEKQNFPPSKISKSNLYEMPQATYPNMPPPSNEKNHPNPPSEFPDSRWYEQAQTQYPNMPPPYIDASPIQMPIPNESLDEPSGSKIPNVNKIAQTINRLKKFAEFAAKAAKFLNPPTLITILVILGVIIIIIIIIVIFMLIANQSKTDTNTTTVPGLTITISQVSPKIPNLGAADFTVDVTCDATCKIQGDQGDIIIYDKQFPAGASLNTDKTKTTGTYTTTQYPISWLLKDNAPNTQGGVDSYKFTFSLITNSQLNNVKIATTIYGDIVGGTGNTTTTAGGATSSVPANSNTCNNYATYAFDFANNIIFSPKNFGDPNCELVPTAQKPHPETQIADIIAKLDPVNKYRWYNVIAKCESHYDPNIEELQGSVDPAHAWGLFQMGRGRNGVYDHGDVYWKDQITNAIKYNQTVIGGSFLYWATRDYNPTTCTL